MINIFEVNETNKMTEQENQDVRTITMGISLLDCIDPDLDALNQKIYEKITTKARNLVVAFIILLLSLFDSANIWRSVIRIIIL